MGVEANVKTVRELLSRRLVIPDYQRPYRWTDENVIQLLQDIVTSMESGKREYRIGTAILHRVDDDRHEIVDGQQRLTTILLMEICDGCESSFMAMSGLRYQQESADCIRANYKLIRSWLHDNTSDDGAALNQYILDQCTMIEIVIADLSEAFQMFDTQNGRGKSLEAYNLLKAYHIRAMEQNTQDEKVQCDREWENAAQYDATPDIQNDPNEDILRQLFNEQLFKSRIWSRNERARRFTKDDIDEFKGFTIDKNHPAAFPFQNPFLLQYLTEKFYRNVLSGTIGTQSRLSGGESKSANPFVNINQPIINGKAFFEYIQTYVDLYKTMFIELGSYQLSEFKEFFYLNCLQYAHGNHDLWEKVRDRSNSFRDTSSQTSRSGDMYLRECFKALCFVMLDKFGEDVFKKYYRILYRLVYKSRLQNYAVKFETVMSVPAQYFSIIYRAKGCADLLRLSRMADEIKNEKFAHQEKIASASLVKFVMEGV